MDEPLIYYYDKPEDDVLTTVFGTEDGVASGYVYLWDKSCIDGDVVHPYSCEPVTVAVTTESDGHRVMEFLD